MPLGKLCFGSKHFKCEKVLKRVPFNWFYSVFNISSIAVTLSQKNQQ